MKFALPIISLIFFLLIAFDVTPYLRGPGEYPPNWRWQYQFTNTFSKIWFPAIIIAGILGFAWLLEKKKEKGLENKIWLIFIVAIVLSYLFQLSVLYFSRAGINVLLHRIINPDLNGYFTTAITIQNLGNFIRDYNKNVLSFPMHASGHMPGAILFFWLINKIAYYLPFLNGAVSKFSPSHLDVRLIWNTLAPYEKTGAVLSSLLIPFLSTLSLIPLYFIAKHLYGIRTAVRSSFLYMVIPSVVLFIPISDVFFPLFFLLSFLSFLKRKYFLSGLIFAFGLFFSLSILPLLLIFAYFFLIKPDKKGVVSFSSGLLILPILLYIFFHFNFNMIVVARTLMKGLPVNRAYAIWIFYNLYDFFIFTGVPISILFFTAIYNRLKDSLMYGFLLMLLLLNFSGSVRGETGRIWLPFMSIMTLITAHLMTKKLKLSKNLFLLIVFLQAMQILVMQEFWVMLW